MKLRILNKREILFWLGLFIIIALTFMFLKRESEPYKLTTLSIPHRVITINFSNPLDTIRASFEISNTGPEALIIREIDLDCNCIDYSIGSHFVYPDSSTQLIISITSNHFSFTRNIVVYCNTADSPILLKVIGIKNDLIGWE